MLTQQEVELINSSFKTALADLNRNAKTPYLDNKGNFATAAAYLRREQVDQGSWVHVQIWRSALLATQDELETAVVKTRQQIEQERQSADRADGSFKNRYRPKSNEPVKGNIEDALNMAQKNLQNLFNPVPETPTADSKTDWPTFEVDFEQMEPADRKKFLVLSAADTKAWMKRRAVVKHRQQYGLDSTEE